jgi:hypothetical protein
MLLGKVIIGGGNDEVSAIFGEILNVLIYSYGKTLLMAY